VEGFRVAQSFFQQAIQKNPNFALAYVGLAESYVYMGSQRWVAPQEAYAKARETLQKALALDQTLGEAHTSLGWMSWRYDWNWPVAEKEFRLALELNPNYVAGQEQLARFLAWSDAWPGHCFLAIGYDGLGRGSDAVPEYQKAVELSQGDTDTVAGLAHSYIAIGKRGLGYSQ
jgi:tetratricopeptide (TPR) repeat protein